MKKWIKVTIDGPSASGKSTVAKKLADKLGFTHLDTGAIYRALAVFYIDRNMLGESDEKQEQELSFFSYYFTGRVNKKRHFLCGKDVTDRLRERETSEISSKISSKSYIRDYATRLQRVLSEDQNIVVEGRDTGSVVFPEAEIKFYLDADPIERAKRRFHELKEKRGYEGLTKNEIINDLQKRDERDCKRELSPLICPETATKIDTTKLQIPQIVDILVKEIKKQKFEKPKSRYIFSLHGKKCSLVYILSRAFFIGYLKLFHRFKVHGLEHYKKNVPAIIASNHVSYLDPPMLAAACPEVIYGLGRKSLFKNPIIRYWLIRMNSLPLSGSAGDKEMIKKVIGMLLKGEKIAIFPEGTRSKDGKLNPLRKGLALLADKGAALIIPTAVIGPEITLPVHKKFPKLFTRLTVAFGPAISYTEILKEIGERKKAREIFLIRVQDAIQDLLDKYKHN